MKNEAEEKAIVFVRELQREELTNSNHSGFYILPQLLGVAHKSFMVGYNEAMRWRDPKEELPEEGVDVFVKMIRSGEYGEETIYTSSHVVNNFYHDSESNPFGCEGYYPAGNGGRVRVTVIGWRPIE